jgi:ABC-2 type transport system permease protein
MSSVEILYRPTLKSNLRALLAVARRDWLRYWRYPLNAITSLFQPLIWLAPVYFMGQVFSVNGKALGFAAFSGTSDYMSFIILGSVMGNLIGAVFWGMGYSLKEEMDAGVLESSWLAPVPKLVLLVGHTLTNLGISTILSLAILLTAGLVFGFHVSGNVLGAVLTVLPMLLGLYGFGFAFASLVLIMRDANTMVDVSDFLVQTLSGSSFPVNSMPRWLLPISLAIPMTYGYDAVRGWLLKTNTLLPIPVEIGLLLVFMVLAVILGTRVFHALEKRVRSRGTLGQF